MNSPSRNMPTALVVEDEPLLRMETADMLADAGYDVIEAVTAQEALTLLPFHPDLALIVTDVQMPGAMQGFELAREVRAQRPAVAIIVCSGRLRPSADQLPAGAMFVDKPFTARVIAHTLRNMGLQAHAVPGGS